MGNVYVMDMEVISPLGVSLKEHFSGVCAGYSGSGYITQFDGSSLPTQFACEVKGDFEYLEKKINSEIKVSFPYDRKSALFCSCVELLKAKLHGRLDAVSSSDIGIFLGLGTETLSLQYLADGALMSEKEGLAEFFRQNEPYKTVNKLLNPSAYLTAYAASVFKSTGPRQTNLSACAASAQAIGAAFESIKNGSCKVAIVGGCDSTINPFIMAAFSVLNMISTRNDSPKTASRPFDLSRDGFVPGEGAGILVLSDQSVAQHWPGPLAQVQGYGSSLDAYKITAPHPEGRGAELSMRRALCSANWQTDDVDYVNAHGTSTPLNDVAECAALKSVFGKALKNIKVSSTKSQIGHLIAAGGIVEFITVVSALEKQIIPPSINVFRQDPKCNVNLATKGESAKIEKALSNSFALAGQNASVAVSVV